MQRTCHQRAVGFTLFEVLVVIGLLAVLFTAMGGFVINTMNARDRLQDRTAQQRAADLVMQQIERAATTCIAGSTSQPGVVGSADSLTLLCRSTQPRLASTSSDPAKAMLSDLQQLTVEFDEQMHRVRLNQSLPHVNAAASNIELEIGRLRLRYHDGERWESSFDSSQAGQLPQAIEIAIWLIDPLAEDNPAFDDQSPDEESAFDALADDDTTADEFEPTFDERAYARQSDELQQLPPPDRIRVIAIVDAAANEPVAEASP